MKQTQFEGTLTMKEGPGISVSLAVFLYEEDGINYAMCPALDIIGYGRTEGEAKASFEVMITEVIEEVVKNGTLFVWLESLGWSKCKPPKTTELINKDESLAAIVNEKSYRTIQTNITIPC